MDSTQIYNTFHNKGEKPDQYASADWAYLADSYQGNNINSTQLLTSPLKTQFIDYHGSFITVPMQLTPDPLAVTANAASNWTATPPLLAMKQSVLDFIGNITVATDQGQTIVNEVNTHHINNIRYRLEHNVEWDYSEGEEYCSAHDSFPFTLGDPSLIGSVADGYDTITGNNAAISSQTSPITNNITQFTPITSTDNLPIVPSNNPFFNKGFYNRIRLIRQNLTLPGFTAANFNGYTTGSMLFTAVIPLRLLHDFFMQLNFPIFNIGFQINFYFNQSTGASPSLSHYPPLMTTDNQLLLAGGVTASYKQAVAPPVIKYVSPGVRLWYRSVKFQPQDTAKLGAMFEKGFTKSINFISTDYIVGSGLPIAPGGPVDVTLTTIVVQPLRVWVLMYPQFLSTPTNALSRSDYASGCLIGLLRDCNIQINQMPYFKNVINMQGQNPQDWYERLKEQIDPQLGAMISYTEFLQTYNLMCIDISRLSDRLQSPTQAVGVQITGTRSDTNPYNVIPVFLIERMNQATFRFSSSDVNLVVGNIEGS
jgi:hypothetical protein